MAKTYANKIVIDAGTFARNAINAIHAGEVAFLHADEREFGRCRYYYEHTGHRCIIGAGLPVEAAKDLHRNDGGPVNFLIEAGTLTVTSDYCEPDQLYATLCDLQMRHDVLISPDRTEDEIIGAKIDMLTELELLSDLHPEPETQE